MDPNNVLQVQIVTLDECSSEFTAKTTFDHPYPTTKIMWIPDMKGNLPDLLATSGDYLRIWRLSQDNESTMECLLNNVIVIVFQFGFVFSFDKFSFFIIIFSRTKIAIFVPR